MRIDGQDEEINSIVEATHQRLQYIVDMVTHDSMIYMALGDGMREPERVSVSSDDVNDVSMAANIDEMNNVNEGVSNDDPDDTVKDVKDKADEEEKKD